jgi:ABC-type Na+ efflux pump permease subunit
MNNFKKYFPSRKFVSVVIVIVILITIFFAVKGIISLFTKGKSKNASNELTPMTVSNIIQKDSNNNGIADWEEYLWELDPNKNGPENKEFIESKKKALIQSGDIIPTDDSKAITDNEALSQQFFAAIVSLQQTDSLDQESMNSIAEAIGKNVEVTKIPDIYTSTMLKIRNDSTSTRDTYRKELTDLINSYSDADIGNELTFIVQGLSNKDPQALYAAVTVAEAYQSFGKKMLNIPVPKSLATVHLGAANNYEKTGQTIKDLAKILTDPIIGMKAILSYKQYNDALYSDLEKITTILQ